MFFTIGVIGLLLVVVLMLSDIGLLFMLFVTVVRDTETTAASRGAGWAGLMLSAGTLYAVIHLQMLTSMGVRSGVFATLVTSYLTAFGSIASSFFYKGEGKWLLRGAAAVGCFFVWVAQGMVSPGAMG